MRFNSLKYFYKIAIKKKSEFPNDFRIWLMRKFVKIRFIDYSLSPADKMKKTNIYIRDNKGTPKLNSFLKEWKMETDSRYREQMEFLMNGPPKDSEPEEDNSIYYYEDPDTDWEV